MKYVQSFPIFQNRIDIQNTRKVMLVGEISKKVIIYFIFFYYIIFFIVWPQNKKGSRR